MHPYRSAPARAFWARTVGEGSGEVQFGPATSPLINLGEKVVSAGSCFAANLIPHLIGAGFHYLRTEYNHPVLQAIAPENFSYGKFSAGYGNIYTARQLRQLQDRCLGRFTPVEDRLIVGDRIIDPFRPGLRNSARSHAEFERLRDQHFRSVVEAFSSCDVFVFTFGLTEAWRSREDGAIYPACPGTVAGTFDPARHEFVNLTVGEVVSDFSAFLEALRSYNSRARFILTVSPVPLVATATDQHVVIANSYSKSVLRVAVEELCRLHEAVTYFPAYEIVVGPQSPPDYLEADRRNPSEKAIRHVMRAFLSACHQPSPEVTALPIPTTRPETADAGVLLSRLRSERECEEAMAEVVG